MIDDFVTAWVVSTIALTLLLILVIVTQRIVRGVHRVSASVRNSARLPESASAELSQAA